MKITKSEAWTILSAIGAAELEHGKIRRERNLKAKIRKSFPAIDKELLRQELRDRLWSETELAQEVIAARKKLEDIKQRYGYGNAWQDAARSFDETKRVVFARLLEEAGE